MTSTIFKAMMEKSTSNTFIFKWTVNKSAPLWALLKFILISLHPLDTVRQFPNISIFIVAVGHRDQTPRSLRTLSCRRCHDTRSGGAVTGTEREADAVAFVIEVVSDQKKSHPLVIPTSPPTKMIKKSTYLFSTNFWSIYLFFFLNLCIFFIPHLNYF